MAVVYMSPTVLNSISPSNGEFPGSWSDADFSKIDDPPLTPNDADYAYFNPVSLNNEFEADWAMGPAPSALTNISVKLWLRSWDRSQNAVTVDVRLWGCLRIAGVRYDHGTPLDIIGTTNAQGDNPLWFSFVWATNPATAVSWLLSDLVGLPAGGHYKVLTDPTGASSPFCKTSSAYLEIAGDPISGNVEPIRSVISPVLRTFRRTKRYFEIHGKPELFDAPILGRISVSHRNAPSRDGAGWGVEPWKRGNLIVLSSEVQPDDTVKLRCLETEDWDCTLWSPLYNDITVSPADLSGIARVDLGGGWNHGLAGMRNQLAYVPRPIDSLFNEVGANQWKVGEDGLHVESGGVTNLILNSSFALGTGNLFTSWGITVGSGSGGSVTEDLADYLLDAANKRRSVKLVGGSTGASYVSQTVAITNVAGRIVFWYKSESGAGSNGWRLQRSSDSRFWNDTAGTWDVGDPGNTLPDTASVPGYFQSKVITASGAVNYTLLCTANVAKTGHFYEAELLWDSISGTDIFTRNPIVTTTVAVTRTQDLAYFGNDQGKRGWDPESGRAYFEFRPDWSHADLADGRVIDILCATHADSDAGIASGNRHTDRLFYIRDNSTTGRWVFRRTLTGRFGTFLFDTQASVTTTRMPARGVWHRFGLRWASLLGEWALGVRGTQLWFDPGDGAVGKASLGGGGSFHPAPDAQMIEWVGSGSGVANVTPDGWTLRKTSGVAWDAGSYSVQSLASGDGYIEFIVNNATHAVMLGFNSNPTADVSFASIDFALHAAGDGSFQVYENGTQKYVGAGEAAVGTVLRVEISGTTVRYLSNGVLKYTAVTPTITYPLYADCSISTLNAYIKRAVMAGSVAADGTRRLSGAVNPRLPQDAISKLWIGSFNGSTLCASGTFRKFDLSRRVGSDAALDRLMKW